MSLSPRKLATDRSKAVIMVSFFFMLFAVGVSCRILYSIVSYLYVSCRGLIEERANLSIVYLKLCCFCSERVPLPLGMSLSPRKLATDRSKAVIMVSFFFMLFAVGVSCRILYSIVSYLYVSCRGLIEERANLSIVYLKLCCFCSERVPLPLGDWDVLRLLLWH